MTSNDVGHLLRMSSLANSMPFVYGGTPINNRHRIHVGAVKPTTGLYAKQTAGEGNPRHVSCLDGDLIPLSLIRGSLALWRMPIQQNTPSVQSHTACPT